MCSAFCENKSFVIAVGQFLARVNRINTKIEVNPKVIFLNQPTQSAAAAERERKYCKKTKETQNRKKVG